MATVPVTPFSAGTVEFEYVNETVRRPCASTAVTVICRSVLTVTFVGVCSLPSTRCRSRRSWVTVLVTAEPAGAVMRSGARGCKPGFSSSTVVAVPRSSEAGAATAGAESSTSATASPAVASVTSRSALAARCPRIGERYRPAMAKRGNGRTAIVTGAGSGIGAATALRLATDGYTVVAADLVDSVHDVAATHDAIVGCVTDVSDESGNRAMVDAALAAGDGERLEALVLNAGVAGQGTISDSPISELDRMYAVNVRGVVLGMQAALPALRAARGAVSVTC